MKFYKLVNNVTGWIVFLVALVTYTMTLEAAASFWDCGEFISGAWKMQVVHPPGAPLFLMIGRVFSLFASSPDHVAWMVNFQSGLTSAFAVLFLFWITTRFASKIIFPKDGEPSQANALVTVAVGAIAALSCTFTDTIWFSAVEGEVYAMSLFFMMFVFWAMMKWESCEDDSVRDRWLILIAFLLGVSSGVHLLSFLAIPGMALIYYFKKFENPKPLGIIIALGVGFVILGLFFKGIVSKLITFIAGFELFFVNGSSMPFGTGFWFFFVLSAILLLGGVAYTHLNEAKREKYSMAFLIYLALYMFLVSYMGAGSAFIGIVLAAAVFGVRYLVKALNMPFVTDFFAPRSLNTFFLSLIMVFLGFSTYFIVIIRANADPPINMNNPYNVFALESYLNREQYGDRPLLYGPHYDAYPIDKEVTGQKYVPGKDKNGNDTYVDIGDKIGYVFDPAEEMLFPRMGSWQDEGHANAYRSMLQPDFKVVNKATGSVLKVFRNTNDNWRETQKAATDYMNAQPNASGLAVKDVVKESYNWKFFFTYQVGVMYWRYFMWNFSGRQNDYQGRYDNDNGRWITGIPFIDENRVGDQSHAPAKYADNGAHNVYYMIPFIIGLIGVVFHFNKDPKSAMIVLALFLVTGVLQVVYLNSPPYEPRERDYTLVGSFVTFCLWIGMGLLAIYSKLREKLSFSPSLGIAFAICIICPILLGTQNWDDHDRSNHMMPRDYALNYLESCKPNAIIFTQGDNDTYPLWYAQEVEGIRTDVRVINLSLLGVDWYIEQLNYAINDAKPIKLTLTPDKYLGSKRDYLQYYNGAPNDENIELSKVIRFIASDNRQTELQLKDGSWIDYVPTRNFKITVDSASFANSDVVGEAYKNQIVSEMDWTLPKTSLLKNDLVTLDIIANNLTERPIYFAVSVSPDAYLGLGDYLQLEGLGYRVVPVKGAGAGTTIASEMMYNNIMNKFRWGNVERKDTVNYTIQPGDSLYGIAYAHDMTVSALNSINGGSVDVKPGNKVKVQKCETVHLDENVLRMTMNLRSNFGRLAEKLIAERKFKEAENLIDKCLYVMPQHNVPLDAFMYQFPHIYYQAGATEKARFLINKLLDQFEAEYYYSMDNYGFPGMVGNAQRANQVVQILLGIAKEDKDNETAAMISKRLSAMNSYQ